MNTEGDKIYLRNPYFWKVDTAGNQLPYIDEVHRVVVKTTEIMDLKTMSGELNVGGAKLSFQDYPVYKEGEQKGNYRAILMSGDVRANQGMSFNLWHKDPVMRAIFNDLRFRQALSVAMNRPKLNEVLYLGKGKPWQATTAPSCTFFEDWVGTYYTEYDPKKAAALLDEMGLKWDKDHKYRLRPDGQTLALNIQFVDLGSSWKERLELKAKDWEAIGIKVAVKEIERSLYLTLQSAAELDFAIWNYEAQESDLQYSKSYFLHGVYWNNPWSLWHQTKGKQGSEPPAEIRRYFDKMEQWAVQLPGSPEYIRLGKEVLGENVKMLWSIGDLIDGPQPAVFAKNLANTPDAGPLIWPGQRFWKLFRPDQWFFR
jgi:peptide/nickel transport system substrate-binding protein